MRKTHERISDSRDRLSDIIRKMKEISINIERRTKELDADVITTRNDPEIKSLWNKLCLLHMKGVVMCEEDYENDMSELCEFIFQPQACIQVLHLTEEETCCTRYFKRKIIPSHRE